MSLPLMGPGDVPFSDKSLINFPQDAAFQYSWWRSVNLLLNVSCGAALADLQP